MSIKMTTHVPYSPQNIVGLRRGDTAGMEDMDKFENETGPRDGGLGKRLHWQAATMGDTRQDVAESLAKRRTESKARPLSQGMAGDWKTINSRAGGFGLKRGSMWGPFPGFARGQPV